MNLPEHWTHENGQAARRADAALLLAVAAHVTAADGRHRTLYMPLVRFPVLTPDTDEDGDVWLEGAFQTPEEAAAVANAWYDERLGTDEKVRAYVKKSLALTRKRLRRRVAK